jgi:protein phosphatase
MPVKKTIAVNWQYGTATHAGWYRENNEDRSMLRIGTSQFGHAYAVAVIADGMSGLGNGGTASEEALQLAKEWMDEALAGIWESPDLEGAVRQSLDSLFHAINRRLKQLASVNEYKLGTTFTVLLLHKERYYIHHTGDCRVYYLKPQGSLRQLTEDQTWLRQQINNGELRLKDAVNHPNRGVLVGFLGSSGEVNLFRQSGYYDPQSLFVLCSDGLYSRYKGEELQNHLRAMDKHRFEPKRMCEELMHRALDRGANDNVTVIAIRPIKAYSTVRERRQRAFRELWRKRLPAVCRNAAFRLKRWIAGWTT